MAKKKTKAKKKPARDPEQTRRAVIGASMTTGALAILGGGAIGLTKEAAEGKQIYRAKGCEECKFVGYRGRIACFELMEMDTTLRDLTFKREPSQVLREVARAAGMSTLQEDGVRKVLQGVSTIEEVLRITHSEDIETL